MTVSGELKIADIQILITKTVYMKKRRTRAGIQQQYVIEIYLLLLRHSYGST